jgi:hypothetical protein
MFKRISKIFLFSLISLCLFAFLNPKDVNAAQFIVEDYTLSREEILHDDLYVAGENVEINGIVDGDVYIAGTNISITGTISDDLYVAGENITISGNIYGDVVAMGSIIDTSGSVGESAYFIGGSISSIGSITDDLVMIGGKISADGYVDEDLTALGGDISVESVIAEDLIAYGTSLSLSKATVSGETYKELGVIHTQNMKFFSNPCLSWVEITSASLILGISTFLVGALIIYLMPVKTLDVVKKSTDNGEEFIKSFATGFVVLFVAAVPLTILLSLTVVGLPIAGILIVLLTFLILYSKIWVEIGIGKFVLLSMKKKKFSFYLALLVGRCISIIMSLIPIVGTIYSVIITLAGTGAFFRMKYDLASPAKKKASKKVTKKK